MSRNFDRFKREMAALKKRQQEKADQLVRKTAFDLFKSVVEKSPVDQGTFIQNWQVGFDSVNSDISNEPNKDRDSAIQRGAVVLTAKVPNNYLITNSLPYAQRLENGYSTKAPAGMVRITVVEFKPTVDKLARELKNT